MINYTTIKQIAAEQGGSVNDLLALAPKNDPFYTGRPSDIRDAEWFAALWQRFGLSTGVHLRAVHYLTQAPANIKLPTTLTWVEKKTGLKHSTDVYINVDRCWEFLVEAGKYARYLGLVDAEAFIDAKHPKPILFANFYTPEPGAYDDPTPRYEVEDLPDTDALLIPDLPGLPSLPEASDFPGLPHFNVEGYNYIQQDYLLEVWAEKTTINRDLEPICRQYGANLITGQGELSITAVIELLRHRVRLAGRPARIFYVSDFDPAGLGMPISIARKIEFYANSGRYGHDLDVELHPIVLTPEQVEKYQLPRVPNDAGDRRVGNFERDHGEGRVELDALMALHPGELGRIVAEGLLRYHDPELENRSNEVRWQARQRLRRERNNLITSGTYERWGQAEQRYRDILSQYVELQGEFTELVRPFQQKLDELKPEMFNILGELEAAHLAAQDELRELDLDIEEEYPLPEPETNPIEEPLYRSDRDYFDQLVYFKAHRHGSTNGHEGDDA